MAKNFISIPRFRRQGFTLIELAAVIVIIGLLAGGIMVGQNLIKSAAIRSQIAQVTKFNNAIEAFKIKYNAVPGDLSYATATRLGFSTGDGTYGKGNGDSFITPDTAYTSSGLSGDGTEQTFTVGTGEISYLWKQLVQASLIPESYDGSQATIKLGNTYPRMTLNTAAGLVYYGANKTHYYQLGISISANVLNGVAAMSAVDARTIDNKLDDGLPFGGNVTSRQVSAAVGRVGTTTNCTTSYWASGTSAATALTANYNTTDTLDCSIAIATP